MNFFDIINAGWLSSLIGLASLGGGAIFYFLSKTEAKPKCQIDGIRVIGPTDSTLNDEVKIFFAGKQVETVSKTTIRFWNAGRLTVRGSDIVDHDAIKFLFDNADVLQCNIVSFTRNVNNFSATFSGNEVLINFDFLDRDDGATIEILHSSNSLHPEISGTIRGVPKGIEVFNLNQKIIFPDLVYIFRRRPYAKWIFVFLFSIVGIFGIATSLRDQSRLGLNSQCIFCKVLPFAVGVMYLLLPAAMLYLTRRRYPKQLDGK